MSLEIDAACHCPIVFVVNFPVFVPCFDGFLKACSRLYFYDYKENKEPSSVKIVLVSHYTAKCNIIVLSAYVNDLLSQN